MTNKRTNAQVGPLKFPTEFSDPVVDRKQQTQVVEHKTINDHKNVIQIMGENVPEYSIEGVIYDDQLELVDTLPSRGEIQVLTERFTGMAVVTNVSTGYRREADPASGKWAYDVAIDLKATKPHWTEADLERE